MACGIYKYENLITHQKYIGQSSDLEARQKKHEKNVFDSKRQEYLYRAIRKYGLHNFSFEILEAFDVFDQERLNELECYYIDFFHSLIPDGYNMVPGGSNGAGLAKGKSVYQFDLQGNFLAKFYSAKDAATQTGANHSAICSCCRKERKHTKNFQWSYLENDPDIGDISGRVNVRQQPILQFTLDQVLLNTYSNLTEASQATNIAKSLISNVCRGIGKTAGGFIWRYANNLAPNHQSMDHHRKKPVLQYNLDGELVAEYDSLSDAFHQTGINLGNIQQVCQFRRKTAGGYIWKYKNKE